MPDVAGVHDDELRVEPAVARPRVVLSRAARAACVSTQFGITRRRSGRRALLLEARAHRLADRDDAVGAPEVEADEPAQQAHQRAVLEPLQLDRDLGEHVLADDDERDAVAPRHEQRDVGDDRRVGHAEDDVGTRAAEPLEQRAREVGRVVRGPGEDLRALEGGRGTRTISTPFWTACAGSSSCPCRTAVTTRTSISSASASQSSVSSCAVASTPGQ